MEFVLALLYIVGFAPAHKCGFHVDGTWLLPILGALVICFCRDWVLDQREQRRKQMAA